MSETPIVHNESLFRDVNEVVESESRKEGADDRIAFVCECGDERCLSEIRLHREEYEHVRSVPTWFAALPGHEHPELERVVERNERFWILEKTTPEGVALAREQDPRSKR